MGQAMPLWPVTVGAFLLVRGLQASSSVAPAPQVFEADPEDDGDIAEGPGKATQVRWKGNIYWDLKCSRSSLKVTAT